MMPFSRIMILIPLLCIAVYTASYGVWTWKRHNRLGACVIFIFAIAAIALPIYTLWIREA